MKTVSLASPQALSIPPHWSPSADNEELSTATGQFSKSDLRAALSANDSMRIVVQPQFNLRTGQMNGAEALARWTHNGIEIPPRDFLPAIIENGLEKELFKLILKQTLQLVGELHRRSAHCPISINASARVLSDSTILANIDKCFKYSELPVELIKIEVTEDCEAADLDLLARQLLRLRECGFSISMDDFGAGHSSMKRLVKLPLSELKIDRMFILEMSECLISNAIVEASLELGIKLGIKVVAEGIETAEQVHLLRNMGCENGQGYALSLPVETEDFLNEVTQNMALGGAWRKGVFTPQ